MEEATSFVDSAQRLLTVLTDELSRVLRGKREFLSRLTAALVVGGHVLVEDAPGMGKTTIAKALARLIGIRDSGGNLVPVQFRRIQFTPDLLPYDITGVDVFDPKHQRFVFSPGPVFSHIVLADEINRTTPKVQSALLEVMAENQVSVGTTTYPLDDLFFVIATENPVEFEGTYALPLAQLDRFFMKLSIDPPDVDTEIEILTDEPSARVLPRMSPVCDRRDILTVRATAGRVFANQRIIRSLARIADRSRRELALGVSPRGTLMLLAASRVWALLHGRDFVTDQDVIDLAPYVLSHRILLKDQEADPVAYVDTLTREQFTE